MSLLSEWLVICCDNGQRSAMQYLKAPCNEYFIKTFNCLSMFSWYLSKLSWYLWKVLKLVLFLFQLFYSEVNVI